MGHALDLAVIWLYCLAAVVFIPVNIPFVAAALTAVIYACGVCLVRSGRMRIGMTAVFLVLSLVCRQLLVFAPLALYTLLDASMPSVNEGGGKRICGDMSCRDSYGCDIVDTRGYVLGTAVFLLGASFYITSESSKIWFIAAGCAAAGLIQYKTGQCGLLDERYRRTRDDSVEKNRLLREKNQSILEKQDYEIYTATLRERNRIAREIHDNVGHMLSRSILMVGAMKAVHGDGSLKDALYQLEDTLNAAMTSVRQSVHDLHDEAINLKEVLESLAGEYTFCDARLEYDMGYDVPREIRYGFIAIVKEALNNVMKHSNATQVWVVVREHPGLYQLVIEDNGTTEGVKKRAEYGRGIGIRNMKERVDAFGGNLEIRTQKGWRIYITVPKKAEG